MGGLLAVSLVEYQKRDGKGSDSAIQESGLFACKTLAIDVSTLTSYELTAAEQKLYLLLASLLFAQEHEDYRNQHGYFRGAMNHFTP